MGVRSFLISLLWAVQGVAAKDWLIVASEGMSFPIFGQQNSHPGGIAVVGMPSKPDAKKIEAFALVPIHARP